MSLMLLIYSAQADAQNQEARKDTSYIGHLPHNPNIKSHYILCDRRNGAIYKANEIRQASWKEPLAFDKKIMTVIHSSDAVYFEYNGISPSLGHVLLGLSAAQKVVVSEAHARYKKSGKEEAAKFGPYVSYPENMTFPLSSDPLWKNRESELTPMRPEDNPPGISKDLEP